MKTLLTALFVVGTLSLATGCATPAYTGGLSKLKFPEERASGQNPTRVTRNMYWEWRMITDDVNALLLLDPVSGLSKWNIK